MFSQQILTVMPADAVLWKAGKGSITYRSFPKITPWGRFAQECQTNGPLRSRMVKLWGRYAQEWCQQCLALRATMLGKITHWRRNGQTRRSTKVLIPTTILFSKTTKWYFVYEFLFFIASLFLNQTTDEILFTILSFSGNCFFRQVLV